MSKKESGKSIILEYLKQHVGKWVSNADLRASAHTKGLMLTNDVPRTIRLLRQEGWKIDIRGDGYVMLISLEKGVGRGERKAISEKIRYEVLSRDEFKCQACGRAASEGVKLQIDHKVPVDWGGTNDISNLVTLCDECNRGKKAWTDSVPSASLTTIMNQPSVEKRIEALFDSFPNQDIPSTMIQLVSKGSLDWQRALRKVREKTGKKILPTKDRRGYHYFRD